MDLIQILQIVFIFVSFLLSLLFVLLPLYLVPPDATKLTIRRTQRVVDLCGCFAGGVFLGTCFLQLLPHVERKFDEAFSLGNLPLDYCSTITQFVVMLGFFLVLLMEQIIKVCQRGRSDHVDNGGVVDSQEMGHIASYIVTVSSCESDTEVDSDAELVQHERKKLVHHSESNSSALRKGRDETKALSTRNGRTKSRSTENVGDRNRTTAVKINGTRSNAEHVVLHTSCGHLHDESHDSSKGIHSSASDDFGLHCIVLLLALSVHSLLEGVAIGLQDDLWTFVGLTIGIGVHGVLMAFSLGVSLARQMISRCRFYKISTVFSLMIPVGISIGMIIVGLLHKDRSFVGHGLGFIGTLVSAVLQGLTAGTFVYVIFFDILQSQINRDLDRILKVFITFLGFVIIGVLRFVITEHH